MSFKIIRADGRVIYVPLCRDSCHEDKKTSRRRKLPDSKRSRKKLAVKRSNRIKKRKV
jgi:hypothetical protein